MKRLTDEQIEQKITKAFEEQTGLLAAETMHAFPMSLHTTVHTETRTFHGLLTWSGRPKKDSFIEETYQPA